MSTTISREQFREEEEFCEHCGRTLIYFMHHCPNSSNYEEIYGCPIHDDVCGFCKE